MKNLMYIFNFIVLVCMLSCGKNSNEQVLYGKWYEIENGHSSWYFYPDSLVLNADTKEVLVWEAIQGKIEFKYPTFYWDTAGKPVDIEDQIRIDYKLSDTNDSLFGFLINRYGKHKFSLLKAENYLEYLNKKYGIAFSLPKDDIAERIKIGEEYGLKLFIGRSNNKIYGKTELSKDLSDVDGDIKLFKAGIRPNERPEIDSLDQCYDYRFHIRVFADKSISNEMLIKKLPRKIVGSKGDSIPLKIYRMFENSEKDNLDLTKGKLIKTVNTIM